MRRFGARALEEVDRDEIAGDWKPNAEDLGLCHAWDVTVPLVYIFYDNLAFHRTAGLICFQGLKWRAISMKVNYHCRLLWPRQ